MRKCAAIWGNIQKKVRKKIIRHKMISRARCLFSDYIELIKIQLIAYLIPLFRHYDWYVFIRRFIQMILIDIISSFSCYHAREQEDHDDVG